MLAPNGMFAFWKLVVALETELAVFGSIANITAVDLDNVEAAVRSTAYKGMCVFDERDTLYLGAVRVFVCLAGAMNQVSFESEGIPDLDSTVV